MKIALCMGSLIAAALMSLGPVNAEFRPVDSAECKEITARIVQEVGAQFDKYSPSGMAVFFKDPGMTLSCTSHRLTGISTSWDRNAFPNNWWFTIVAKAGHAVTGVDTAVLDQALRKCRQDAINEATEMADIDVVNARIECQAFTRDGGGVFMSVWINDHETRKGIEER